MTDGGWTVFMRRYDGSQDFNLGWIQYSTGFGNLGSEHWLGNDKLYYITNQKPYRMRMDATIWSTGEKKYSLYDRFRISYEGYNYKLHVSGYSGNTDHDYWAKHNRILFSTKDKRNIRIGWSPCANKGGHWYNGSCPQVNPTGLYKDTGSDSMLLGSTPVKEMTLKIKSV